MTCTRYISNGYIGNPHRYECNALALTINIQNVQIETYGNLQVSRVGLLGGEHSAEEDTCNLLVFDYIEEETDPYAEV